MQKGHTRTVLYKNMVGKKIIKELHVRFKTLCKTSIYHICKEPGRVIFENFKEHYRKLQMCFCYYTSLKHILHWEVGSHVDLL